MSSSIPSARDDSARSARPQTLSLGFTQPLLPRGSTPPPPNNEPIPDESAWLIDEADVAAALPRVDPKSTIDYNGRPIHCLVAEEPAEPGAYDRKRTERNALELACRGLRVFKFLGYVVTSNSQRWPSVVPLSPDTTVRPLLTLDNIFLAHWLDEHRPHFAFIPGQRTFTGPLLRKVYWNNDPAKMLERYSGLKFSGRRYRTKNSNHLGTLYYRLHTAFVVLKWHVYPPSMRSWVELEGKDLGGMGRWHYDMRLAMHYGRRDVTRVLELVGALTMMIALSRQQTGSKDSWRRVLALHPYYQKYPCEIDAIENSFSN